MGQRERCTKLISEVKPHLHVEDDHEERNWACSYTRHSSWSSQTNPDDVRPTSTFPRCHRNLGGSGCVPRNTLRNGIASNDPRNPLRSIPNLTQDSSRRLTPCQHLSTPHFGNVPQLSAQATPASNGTLNVFDPFPTIAFLTTSPISSTLSLLTSSNSSSWI